MKRRFVFGIVFWGMAAACSVKEDRDSCPNLLTLVVSRAAQQMSVIQESSLHVAVRNGIEFKSSSTIDPSEYLSGFEIKTPRGTDNICAFTGIKNMLIEGDRLLIPEGMEADSLFAYSAAVDCSGEAARDTVILHKQFATMTLVIKGSEGLPPYMIEVSGHWCGHDLYTLAPAEGRFKASLRPISGGVYKVKIPRQGDDSLTVEIYEKAEGGVKGSLINVFDIGKEIVRSGYRWEAKDLPDMNITIEYIRSAAYISIAEWDDGGAKEYDI